MRQILNKLGPGLLYAGAAIGVSHLVQSTRAGASYGMIMILVVLLSNAFKYPFFAIGPRYAASTGKSLIAGYRELGKWPVILVFIMTLGTVFTVQAAVTIVTAGIAVELSGFGTANGWSIALLLAAVLLLVKGRYHLLDRFMKYIILILTITTLVTIAVIIGKGQFESFGFEWNISGTKDLLFLAALIGWMPAPLDISIWHSIWTLEKKKEEDLDSEDVKRDFNIGFWGTALLACAFVMLGTFTFFHKDLTLEAGAAAFAGQFIDIYAETLGEWTRPFIATAAFTTMLSTTVTVLDGFARVLKELVRIDESREKQQSSWYIYVLIAAGALIIIVFFTSSMRALVDLATTISFVIAPLLAYLNYRVFVRSDIPLDYRFNAFELWWARLGIVVLLLFSVYFLFL